MSLTVGELQSGDLSRIRRRVLRWYDRAARPLAFRMTSDPWAILVSEVMAQQTQAARAAAAWSRFVVLYPTPAALGAASPGDVLRAWRGLGYNRRALALQRAARVIVEQHRGVVPDDLDALQRLPGIGPYTARAVSALAFGRAVGAVDTNVRRVLGRAFLSEGGSPASEIQALADELVPRSRPGHWTHALMDLGATLCRPRNPRCDDCPLRPACVHASSQGLPSAAPSAPADPAAASPDGGRARASGRRPSIAFPTTARWLRGRILDRLRDVPAGAWLRLDGRIGDHEPPAVAGAMATLASEGLLELRPGHPQDARLPGS